MSADRPRIASELSISERNVGNHVRKILKKLGFSSGPASPPEWRIVSAPLGGGLGIPGQNKFGA
jgi:hypothetical protein